MEDEELELEEGLDLDTNERIENFLIKSEFRFEHVDEGFWLIHDDVDHIDNIVVYHSPPVVTFRVKLLNVPELDDDTRLELFTKLLELNSTSMVAGAYGLEDESVVVVDTLQAENLDFNEFQASIDSITLAIREHYQSLRRLIRGEEVQVFASDEGVESLDDVLPETDEDAEDIEAAAAEAVGDDIDDEIDETTA